jgi:hypothetical protein
VLLLIPIAALVPEFASLDWRTRAALAAGIVLIALPVVVLAVPGRIGSALYDRVLISHYFFGGVLLLGVLLVVRIAEPHSQRGKAFIEDSLRRRSGSGTSVPTTTLRIPNSKF